jgi:hypothetical protein
MPWTRFLGPRSPSNDMSPFVKICPSFRDFQRICPSGRSPDQSGMALVASSVETWRGVPHTKPCHFDKLQAVLQMIQRYIRIECLTMQFLQSCYFPIPLIWKASIQHFARVGWFNVSNGEHFYEVVASGRATKARPGSSERDRTLHLIRGDGRCRWTFRCSAN